MYRPRDVFISLVVAFNFAVAQPVLELFGRHAPFFVAHDLSGLQVTAVAVIFTLVAPLVLAAVVTLISIRIPRLGRLVHLVALSALLSALVLAAIARSASVPGIALIAAAVVLGLLGALAYDRYDRAREFMRWGLIGPPAFLFLFLVHSPASGLIGADQGNEIRASVERSIPIVFIVFDELPLASLLDDEGEVDRHLYPNFRRLAEAGYWFRNATTVHPRTDLAVPAILTGTLPRSPESLPVVADHPPTLFDLVADDYDVVAHEPVSSFCVQQRCESLRDSPGGGSDLGRSLADMAVAYLHIVTPPRFAEGLPAVDEQWAGFVNQGSPGGGDPEARRQEHKERVRAALAPYDAASGFRDFVTAIDVRTRPTLYFGHFMLPHAPWVHLPSGSRYTFEPQTMPGMINAKTWGPDAWYVHNAHRRHLLALGFTDRLLGELLDRLQVTGLFDEAIVILTSDHGAAFLPDTRRRALTEQALGEMAYVPFFIKLPKPVATDVDPDRPVQTIDIVATLVDVLGIEGAPPLDGRSVLGSEPRTATERGLLLARGLIPLPDDASPLEEAVARKYVRFASSGGLDLFRFGPHGELVGQEATPLVSDQTSSLSIEVESIADLADVDPESGYLPLLLRGVVETDDAVAAEDRFLAFVLNGRVAAIAKTTYESRSMEVRYETLLDPALIRAGDNELTAYEIVGEPGSTLLHRVVISDS